MHVFPVTTAKISRTSEQSLLQCSVLCYTEATDDSGELLDASFDGTAELERNAGEMRAENKHQDLKSTTFKIRHYTLHVGLLGHHYGH
jgi:hypothetical protein